MTTTQMIIAIVIELGIWFAYETTLAIQSFYRHKRWKRERFAPSAWTLERTDFEEWR